MHGTGVPSRQVARQQNARMQGNVTTMGRNTLALTIVLALLLSASANAAGKGYASARASCLAQAGTTEAIFSARKATYAQGAVYKQCMTAAGHDVVVRKRDGSQLY